MELDGEVAPTGSGRGGGVGELRGFKAELLVSFSMQFHFKLRLN